MKGLGAILDTSHNHSAFNSPFPSSCLPPLQSESKSEVFVMVISSTLNMNETNFHKENFALRLVLKRRQT